MPNWQIIVSFAGGAGLLLGILVARRSHQIDPLQSAVGHAFHYLASAALVAVPLSVITGIVIADLRSGVKVAVVSLAAAMLLVTIYAFPESIARRAQSKLTAGVPALAWERWVTIARPIGDFNAWLLMGLLYFTLLLPFGTPSRLFSDRLRLKKVPDGEPLWLARERPAELALDEARRQF